MNRSQFGRLVLMGVLTLGAGSTRIAATADDQHRGHGQDKGQSVTVAFGAGLNSSAAANHHVLPRTIEVDKGGVVNFAVAGFHQIFVYNPGVTPDRRAGRGGAVPAGGPAADAAGAVYQLRSSAGSGQSAADVCGS